MANLDDALGIVGAVANPLFTYSPTDIDIILHTGSAVDVDYTNLHKISGYAEGTFVQIERDRNLIETSEVSMDGRLQRKMHNRNSLYTITITLAQTSVSNFALENMYTEDVKLTRNLRHHAKQWISISDQKASPRLILGRWVAWVESIPPITYSGGLETRQWVIKAFGGNNEALVRGNTSEFEGITADAVQGIFGKFNDGVQV